MDRPRVFVGVAALLGGAFLGCSANPLSPSAGGEAPLQARPAALASARTADRAVTSSPAAAPSSDAQAAALPQVFDVHNASTHYDFRLVPAPASKDEEECSGAADLVIFLHGTTTETQRIHLESVCIVLDDAGALLVSSAQPGEAQGTLHVDDFDFDGREDLAVQVNHEGSYGSPTYRVFLGLDKPGEFTFSPGLSTLGGLGLFQVDRLRKRLVTHEKSGCCLHMSEEHIVVTGRPQRVFQQTETLTPAGDLLIETQTLVNGHWRKSSRHKPAEE
jgi:hypothetical protein